MGKVLALAVAAVFVVAAAGCGTSGRALEAPPPGATAPPREGIAPPPDEPMVAPITDTFNLNTVSWSPGADIPNTYTCDGEDISPPLGIANTPPETVELAMVATGSGEVGWVVAGIDPSVVEVPEGTVPPGAVVGTNSADEVGWTGPCPPEGGGPRLFDITLYALSAPSDVVEAMPTTEAVALITDPARVLATSVLTGTVSR